MLPRSFLRIALTFAGTGLAVAPLPAQEVRNTS